MSEIARPSELSGWRAPDLVGQLLLLQPTRHDQPMETSAGANEATFTRALVVHEDGSYMNCGEIIVFWEVVRRQLHEASPWIAGTIEKGERAYRLEPPTDEQFALVSKVLTSYKREPAPVTEAPPRDDDGADATASF